MIAGKGQVAPIEDQSSVPLAGKIEHPSAWTAVSLDAETGLLRLNDACLAELEAIAAELRDNPLPIVALRPADFAMPQCRATMERASAILRDGVGFVLLDKLPVMPRRPKIARLIWTGNVCTAVQPFTIFTVLPMIAASCFRVRK